VANLHAGLNPLEVGFCSVGVVMAVLAGVAVWGRRRQNAKHRCRQEMPN